MEEEPAPRIGQQSRPHGPALRRHLELRKVRPGRLANPATPLHASPQRLRQAALSEL